MSRNLWAKGIALVKRAPRVLLLALAGAATGAAAGGVYGLLVGALYGTLEGQFEIVATFGLYFAGYGALAGALTGGAAGVFETAGAPEVGARCAAPPREQGSNSCRWSQVKTGASNLRQGDVILVVEKQVIPVDGEVVDGFALIDECALTGESSPAICQADCERGSVLGGTCVVAGRILVRITGTARTIEAPTRSGPGP
jgi:cation transport ATPase